MTEQAVDSVRQAEASRLKQSEASKDFRTQVNTLNEEKYQLHKQIKEIENQLDEHQNELVRVAKERNELKAQVDTLEQHVEGKQMDSVLQKAAEAQELATNDIVGLRNNLKELQDQYDELQKEKDVVALKNVELTTAFEHISEELKRIEEDSGKLSKEHLTKNIKDSVKLKPKKFKTAQELELVVESLRRVIEKQIVEMDLLKGQNAKFMKEGIPPSDGVGTGAVRKAFVGIVHPR